MEKSEIIRRLEKIATHAIHFIGEPPFVMSLDDGIAAKDAVELLKENEWRDAVKDPPAGGELNRAVLVVREIGKGREGYRKIDFGIYNEADCSEGGRWNKWGVIYWMPLPEIPEEGADR